MYISGYVLAKSKSLSNLFCDRCSSTLGTGGRLGQVLLRGVLLDNLRG